jgi:hypothetical protein
MTAQRMVLELDTSGRFKKVMSMAMTGTSEPYCSFKGDYNFVK